MVKLSIIIPYYKTYDLTIKLLDVLIKQLNDEVEVFLIDDGCNEKRLDKYKDKINIVHLEENKGGASSCNEGIKIANGKYIAIIDSDDIIDVNYINVLLKTIDERKEDVIYFDWQDLNNGVIVHHPENYAPWKAIYKKDVMPLFREGWRLSYDVPFQEDLSKIKHTTYYIDKVLYYYNSRREGSLTLQKEKLREEEIKNMIKLEVTEDFSLGRFNEIKEIERLNTSREGFLFAGDKIVCDKNLADYLLGDNKLNKAFVRLVEILPEKKEKVETKEVKEEKPKRTTRKRKTIAND